jgi:hypothetical protein
MTYTIIQLLLLAVSIAFWNAYVILWGVHTNIPEWNTRRAKWSKIWHGIGLFIRIQILVLIVWVIYDWCGFDWLLMLKWLLLYVNVAGTLYDLIINLVRNKAAGYPPIFYVDDKGVNKILMDILGGEVGLWIARALFLIGSILFVIL